MNHILNYADKAAKCFEKWKTSVLNVNTLSEILENRSELMYHLQELEYCIEKEAGLDTKIQPSFTKIGTDPI